jgi:hypothetical protein
MEEWENGMMEEGMPEEWNTGSMEWWVRRVMPLIIEIFPVFSIHYSIIPSFQLSIIPMFFG